MIIESEYIDKNYDKNCVQIGQFEKITEENLHTLKYNDRFVSPTKIGIGRDKWRGIVDAKTGYLILCFFHGYIEPYHIRYSNYEKGMPGNIAWDLCYKLL